MTPEGDILKYKKYCIIADCKLTGSHLITPMKKNFFIVMIIKKMG